MKNLLNTFLKSQHIAPDAAFLLTSILGVNITAGTIGAEMEKHPGYPSLLSISDVFNNHRIDNLSLRVDAGKLTDVPQPFLTQFKGRDLKTDYFTVVKETGTSVIGYYDPKMRRWTAKYPMNGEPKQQGAKLAGMDAWCKQAGIAYAPTFFVAATDGHEIRHNIINYQRCITSET